MDATPPSVAWIMSGTTNASLLSPFVDSLGTLGTAALLRLARMLAFHCQFA